MEIARRKKERSVHAKRCGILFRKLSINPVRLVLLALARKLASRNQLYPSHQTVGIRDQQMSFGIVCRPAQFTPPTFPERQSCLSSSAA